VLGHTTTTLLQLRTSREGPAIRLRLSSPLSQTSQRRGGESTVWSSEARVFAAEKVWRGRGGCCSPGSRVQVRRRQDQHHRNLDHGPYGSGTGEHDVHRRRK